MTVIPGGFLVLKTSVGEDLAAEGTARDVIRAVQAARKDAGLDVSDRVNTQISGPAPVIEAVQKHAELVGNETLSTSVDFVATDDPDPRAEISDDATKTVTVHVTVAQQAGA